MSLLEINKTNPTYPFSPNPFKPALPCKFNKTVENYVSAACLTSGRSSRSGVVLIGKRCSVVNALKHAFYCTPGVRKIAPNRADQRPSREPIYILYTYLTLSLFFLPEFPPDSRIQGHTDHNATRRALMQQIAREFIGKL